MTEEEVHWPATWGPVSPVAIEGKPCHWCKREMRNASRYLAPTKDHVIPRSSLRGYDPRKIKPRVVWACFACNNLKGDMSVAAWYALMNQVPEWWFFAEKRGPRGKDLHVAMIECGFSMPAIKTRAMAAK